MAIAVTPLLSAISTNNATAYSYTVATAPTSGTLLLLGIGTHGAGGLTTLVPFTVSGLATTWVLIADVIVDNRLICFRGMPSAPTSGTLTVGGMLSNSSSMIVGLLQFDGVSTLSTDGADAIVQVASTNATSSALAVSLAPFGSTSNMSVGLFNGRTTRHLIAGAGFIVQTTAQTGLETNSFLTETAIDTTAVIATVDVSTAWLGVAVEVKASTIAVAAGVFGANRRMLGMGR